ncbi:hypothetical protein ACLB6K_08755 [Microcystis aeruginosa FACHB-524]|uniref:hypothetical protein n=1 Tax=Microcystis aeruginosa TaxID=1126 RepID=UPI000F45A85F|nr:hypothetical protein [Microcystis aeruginosa]ROI11012.1 hypothetical protein ED562_04795 [Microcystis aeruginosa FACHB-524]
MVRRLGYGASIAAIIGGVMAVSSIAQAPTLEAALPQLANITLQNSKAYKGVTLTRFDRRQRQISFKQGGKAFDLPIAQVTQLTLEGETIINIPENPLIVIQGEDKRCGSVYPVPRRFEHLSLVEKQKRKQVEINLSDLPPEMQRELTQKGAYGYVLKQLEFANGELKAAGVVRCRAN